MQGSVTIQLVATVRPIETMPFYILFIYSELKKIWKKKKQLRGRRSPSPKTKQRRPNASIINLRALERDSVSFFFDRRDFSKAKYWLASKS